MVVLIVDDNQAMRRIIGAFINELAEGVQIAECADGAVVVTAYEESRPDWVLMDIRLGAVNGIEASRAIKAQHPQARIVMVTNYDDDGLREAAIAVGAHAYVLKENLSELHGILLGDSAIQALGTQ
jgi:two-component system response regulator DegU